MPEVRDHLDQREAGRSPVHRPPAGPEADERPAITGSGDPRLAHASSGTTADLMHVQRAAGNAAVSSLVAPAVQRSISVDEISTQVAAPTPAEGSGEPATSDDTQEAADHTITAAHIGLNAPMVEASGVVRAQTVIADSIVAENYTPGAGNMW